MKSASSLLQDLLQTLPHLRPQIYFKASLTALSHAMEDLVLVGKDKPLVIANFQQERFYRQESRRYRRIAQRTNQVYVLAARESDFAAVSVPYVTIPLDPKDDLAQEWHLIIIGQKYAACIVALEFASPVDAAALDQARQFKGIWTFDRQVSMVAAGLLLDKILVYRPELAAAVKRSQKRYGLSSKVLPGVESDRILEIDARLFTDRLVTYLQSSQYKQLKAYRTITKKERNERLINLITTAIRSSLKPEEVFQITVRELGQLFSPCRCLLYPYQVSEVPAPIDYEWVAFDFPAMKGENWSLATHPLFQAALVGDRSLAISDTAQDLGIRADPQLSSQLERWQIRSCLLVPIRYQGIWLGILELHHCGDSAYVWSDSEQALVEAIATSVGVALIQAQAYRNLETLNQQLAALERTQSNLIAIVGHELRTPLSTIQICLESLVSEGEMPPEMQQSMLQTALTDLERMRRLIQDFLTLSRLEAGSMRWQIEPISLQVSLDLVLGSLKERLSVQPIPQIVLELPPELPLVQADGEGLIEVLTKLLDNACKFTKPDGKVTIRAQVINLETELVTSVSSQRKLKLQRMLEVIIADTGRGIEPNQLEAIFQRFYQEEGFLRRTIGGTGLGLAICRQIIQKLGGEIWATSGGKNQGSEFHFTLVIA
ncbi:MAG: GAF domain-containing protein [Chlorogloeopsis fritschii C42_A2020_084]|uniref:DICT sensory domain-containing protein n=1 Tax=Chlorogloeopsis fritschii TaxID=1124 RepID=UPI0019D8E5ED|nr:DICT sensory domain-containing protein [Chlorogloeopsis fritschii]MBF2008479.1 GAF domain-containing protein [Chlorogloeopsis fritschii C42_A2020_084]